ncbi:MAG TPA: carboxypeptidase M32 [Ferruginibacter sp.]|nr:carboxypeptidase M32 [Ferruginibacter sp.]
MKGEELYAEYKTKMQKIADLKYASAVLHWDQETYLPPKGSDFRGRQIATLNEVAHRHFTDAALGDLLNDLLNTDLDDAGKRNVSLTLEDYTRSKKFTPEFIRKMSETVNKSFHAWIKARKQNSFAVFKNELDEVVQLKKQEAEIVGYERHPYDALMNEYDRGLTTNITDELFSALRPQLMGLLGKIRKQPQVNDDFLRQYFDKDSQWKFGIGVLEQLQFDFEAGRQDTSEHPFTTSFNSRDVRITTRVDENDFSNMLWSCIHEGGHALYEQGLPAESYGLPSGEYCSLSIHESQSRLWENCVGRGLGFWKYNYPSLQHVFPGQLGKISLHDFYKGINKVEPSLVRTEADEITYHFHIMIRYEIEKRLVEGSISTAEIPLFWNDHYKEYLGITVPDDKKGCLQDVHWSHGSFGYFPTYTIGSLYASQFYAAILRENPSVEEGGPGNNKLILSWLQQHIYKFGRYFNSGDLCMHATGQLPDSSYYLEYALKKFTDIYET